MKTVYAENIGGKGLCSLLVTASSHLHNMHKLNMRWIATEFTPRLLTDNQKKLRLEFYTELKNEVRNNPDFLSKMVTVVKVWSTGTA